MNNQWPFKILVKYASRGRPKRFFDGLDNIFELAEFPDKLLILISLDTDDELMCNDEVKEKLSKYKNIHVCWGLSKNKIHATNRDFDKVPEHFKDWSIVANFSDDQRWTMYGWDTMIRVDFNNISPDFSHYIAYRDPDTQGSLSTLYIAGRGFYDIFSFIYDEIFLSLFADNLVEDVAKRIGKYHYTGNEIYRHFNPAYNYSDFPEDEMFRQQQDVGWQVDSKTYYDLLANDGLTNYLKQFNL